MQYVQYEKLGSEFEEMSEKEKELDKEIEDLKQRKKELMVEEGKACKCNKCGEIVMKNKCCNEAEKDGLCYTCWSKKVKEDKRNKLIQIFKDARIIDMIPSDNPYSFIESVEKIILEVNGKRYEVIVAGHDEFYIGIQEGFVHRRR